MVCPTFTSKASAYTMMEINAVGNFLARFLGSLSTGTSPTSTYHFSLPLSLSTHLKHLNCLKLFTQLLLCRGIIKSLPCRPVCDTHLGAQPKTVSAFCETNSIEQGVLSTESSTRYMSTPTSMSVSLTSRRACSRSMWMNRRPRLLRTKANCMIY